jgi:hypothetical protein
MNAPAAPNVTLAEWWRGRTDRREAVLRGLLVEPVTDEVMKLAGLALGRRNVTDLSREAPSHTHGT